jgi:hypothetical protein
MELVAARKLAAMETLNSYITKDVIELFEEPYPFYLIYELLSPLDIIKAGEKDHMESAG